MPHRPQAALGSASTWPSRPLRPRYSSAGWFRKQFPDQPIACSFVVTSSSNCAPRTESSRYKNVGPGFRPIAIRSSPVNRGGGFNSSGGAVRITRSQNSTREHHPPGRLHDAPPVRHAGVNQQRFQLVVRISIASRSTRWFSTSQHNCTVSTVDNFSRPAITATAEAERPRRRRKREREGEESRLLQPDLPPP